MISRIDKIKNRLKGKNVFEFFYFLWFGCPQCKNGKHEGLSFPKPREFFIWREAMTILHDLLTLKKKRKAIEFALSNSIIRENTRKELQKRLSRISTEINELEGRLQWNKS